VPSATVSWLSASLAVPYSRRPVWGLPLVSAMPVSCTSIELGVHGGITSPASTTEQSDTVPRGRGGADYRGREGCRPGGSCSS